MTGSNFFDVFLLELGSYQNDIFFSICLLLLFPFNFQFTTADFIKNVFSVYTHSIKTIYLSPSTQVAKSSFSIKSPVSSFPPFFHCDYNFPQIPLKKTHKKNVFFVVGTLRGRKG